MYLEQWLSALQFFSQTLRWLGNHFQRNQSLAQRAMQTQTADGTLTISDEEKDQLLAAMNELKGDK